MVAAGFVGFEITSQADVFSGAPQQSSAANYGTQGINFRARKAVNSAEWVAALEELVCMVPRPPMVMEGTRSMFGADAVYDAADRGCADGPLDDIAAAMRRLAPGQTLEVHATERSVAVDLPAWCRMAGHKLVQQQGDRYLIRRGA